MYIRYEFDSTASNNSTHHTYILDDIVKALNGTYTSVSQFRSNYCNKALSSIEGSVQWGSGATDLFDLVYQDSYEVQIRKYHGAKKTNFTPSSILNWRWQYGRRPNARMLTSNNTNTWPTTSYRTSSEYWAGDTSPGTSGKSSYANTASRIHVFAHDYMLFIAFQDGQAMLTAGILDYEQSASDEYNFTANNLTSPQQWLLTDVRQMVSGTTVQSNVSYRYGRSYYYNSSGELETGSTQNVTDYFYGNNPDNTHSHYQPTFFPLPNVPISGAAINGGTGHFMVPVVHTPTLGSHNNSQGNFGKYPTLYRTSDDLAGAGDVITDNGIDYVVIPIHLTGDYTYTSSNTNKTACYLIPKTVGGV